MNQLLEEMLAATRRDLAKQKMLLPEKDVLAMCTAPRQVRDFAKALKMETRGNGAPHILGRVEKADPEAGFLRNDFDALELAQNLQKAGCAALAVVTEPHFYCGKNSTLSGVSRLVTVPVARFDCIIERYQIAQAYLWGADAVTLFPAMLDQSELLELAAYAASLKLHIWGIAYTLADLERLIKLPEVAVVGCDNEGLLSLVPEEKVAVYCGETPVGKADAWCPEHLLMQTNSAEELQKLLRR